MKGDFIEVCLAALRGHSLFKEKLQSRLEADGLAYPVVFQYLCDLCRLVQYMDACLHKRVLKKNRDPVARLSTRPPFNDDPLVQLWKEPVHKCFCLAALCV